MKKIVFALFSVILILGITTAFGAVDESIPDIRWWISYDERYGKKYDGYDFYYDKDTNAVTYYVGPSGTDKDIVIPSEIDGMPVTRIYGGFRESYGPYKITIGIKPYRTFPWGFSANTIIIPNSITSIAANAFYDVNCTGDIIIPDSVVSAGPGAFSYARFNKITLSKNIKVLPAGLFDCASFTDITIPNGVERLEGFRVNWSSPAMDPSGPYGAFSSCTSLENVTIPDSVTYIGDCVFQNCWDLNNITIPDSVIYIGEDAFRECKALTNITLSKNLKVISAGMFNDCTKLSSITIPDGVIEIRDDYLTEDPYENSFYQKYSDHKYISGETNTGTFAGCTNLKSIIIPRSVTSIGNTSFKDCKELTIYTYRNSYAEQYAIENNIPISYLTDYELSDLNIYDTDQNLLSTIPTSGDFALAFDVEKKSSVTDAKLIIALYDENGACLDVYVDESFSVDLQTDKTFTFTKQIMQIQDKKIGKIKVFIWDGLNNVMPVSDVKSI